MAKQPKVRWAAGPEEHDYPAARAFLSLVLAAQRVASVVDSLRRAPTVHHRANDLLRASQLPLLPADDPEVKKELKRIRRGRPLAPVLLMRGDLEAGRPLTIADGYHRVCASYHLDEDAAIPARIAERAGE